uniref:uncharacterized protein LOC105351474 n=1 Tax=Fragaria vesca subsp. vesca TaxID=101020 RepID=UPI0005CB4CD2|nr:PREDICTED: uncharacterized protein LOC105351474 [Fragaria vesca subsp. vesca]
MKGISEAHVDNTIEAASKLLSLRFITASQLLAQRIETSKLLPMGFVTASQLLAQRIETSKLIPMGFVTASQLLAQRLKNIQITSESRELDNMSWKMAIRNPYFVKGYDKRGCGRTDIVLVQEQTRWDFTLYNLRTHTWNKQIEFPRGTIEWDQFDIAGSCRGLL